MASFIGKINICDRCGATAYSRKTGEGRYDGGYTTLDKFEEMQEGWNTSAHVQEKIVTLCPACNEKWHKVGRGFLDGYYDNA